ncbi:MAG TPA: BatD family protein [Gemmatimonadales bacterium]|nr:BatD family protein [Gemmatimonadales bacterium]
MIAWLLAPWLVIQGSRPELKATVDREHLAVGDDLVYSVQAVSRSTAPLRVLIPTITGFEIIGRSERSSVSHFGGSSRSTTLELRLRALKPGKWAIGPARAVQGTAEVVAPAVTVRVDELPGATAMAANPSLRALLEQAPPPATAGQPAVNLALSSRRGAVGDQIDVLTAAWFPRELRVRLRRPPTLQPPVIEGVWSYPQPVPPGIAATRTVGGTLYDLFVAHQVVFPLRPGRIVVTPAVLKYSVPLALQFFSQEERYTLTSAPETLSVAATPTEGRPAGYTGAVGRELTLTRSVEPATAVPGEPVSVSFELTGEGNPALWPAPQLAWPEGVRSYPDGTDERLVVNQGRLGGTKTFRFTLVPDSSGTLALPGAQYAYYDGGAGAFRTAQLAGDRLVVAAGTEAKASRPPPPALLPMRGAPWAWRARRAVPDIAWLVAALLPPIALLLRRLRARRRPARPAAPAPDAATLEGEVEALVRTLAPNAEALGDGGLIAALRAAGLEQESAARLVLVRDRLRELRYGPSGDPITPDLAREARQLLETLRTDASRRRATLAASLVIALIGGGAGPDQMVAQAPSPARLYAAGSLHAAASGFLRELERDPRDPATWYNLGATYYRLGLDGRAAAAWLQAHRLAPRDRTVNRALSLVPPPETASASRLWIPPVSWPELALVAIPLWVAGWALLIWRPRRRDIGVALALLGALCATAAVVLRIREERPVAILLSGTPLQLSPHERAPTIAPLEAGTAVGLVRREPHWSMVNAPGGRLGWVPTDSMFRLRSL